MSKPIGNHHTLTLLPHVIKVVPKDSSQNRLANSDKSFFFGFDMDSTLIETKSKMRFSRAPTDWKFFESTIEGTTVSSFQALVDLHSKETSTAESVAPEIVIFSNQGGVITVPQDSKSCVNLVAKLENILLELEKLLTECDKLSMMDHIWIYCSPKMSSSSKKKQSKKSTTMNITNAMGKVSKSKKVIISETKDDTELFQSMRKPNTGMFEAFTMDFRQASKREIPVKLQFYCGDAAGRPKDFSDSDLKFAEKLETKFITPETFIKDYTL